MAFPLSIHLQQLIKTENMNTMNCSPRRMHRGYINNWPSLFDEMLSGKNASNNSNLPSVNISDNETNWHIEVSAPGFAKEDFKVNFEKDVLTVSAETISDSEKAEKNYTRREFSVGSFSRSFRVKESSVEAEKITAVYDNGILNITLPKRNAEEKKGLSINIQ